jgi:hypothetical protein
MMIYFTSLKVSPVAFAAALRSPLGSADSSRVVGIPSKE